MGCWTNAPYVLRRKPGPHRCRPARFGGLGLEMNTRSVRETRAWFRPFYILPKFADRLRAHGRTGFRGTWMRDDD